MFKVQNTRNGKTVKDAVTAKPFVFETKEAAEKMASTLHRNSVLNATAWNSTRPSQFSVIAA